MTILSLLLWIFSSEPQRGVLPALVQAGCPVSELTIGAAFGSDSGSNNRLFTIAGLDDAVAFSEFGRRLEAARKCGYYPIYIVVADYSGERVNRVASVMPFVGADGSYFADSKLRDKLLHAMTRCSERWPMAKMALALRIKNSEFTDHYYESPSESFNARDVEGMCR